MDAGNSIGCGVERLSSGERLSGGAIVAAEGTNNSENCDDPFYRLVPLSVLSEVSVYTARRDNLLR